MKKTINYIIFFWLLFIVSNGYSQKNNNYTQKRDSIVIFIKYAKDIQNTYEKRKFYAEKASELSFLENNDTLRNTFLVDIALAYSKLKDSLNFRKYNTESIKLSQKIEDSSNLAFNYWDLAYFYANYNIKDSAYYNYSKAHKVFKELKDTLNTGKMLINMAIQQKDLKDYTGSEITTVEAIKIFKLISNNFQLYKCYNNLGIIYNQLGDYKQALFYHEEALKYLNKVKDQNAFKENTLNNIGVVYQGIGNHKRAIENFKKALENKNLIGIDPKRYAMLLDNLSLSKLKLKDTTGVFKLFNRSLRIRDSIRDFGGITINKLHLAEYYLFKGDTLKAIKEAKEANTIAANKKNFNDKLAALKFLSIVEKNYKYADEYINLNDSLIKEERLIRNKFTRIKFETDEFKERTEQLSKQRKLILITSGIVILLGSLIFIIINQRIKNKKLQLEKDQQKYNEEIYNLMLTQQNKLDEGRRNEKKRMSEELHDGVLGKLFGTRLILGALNSSDKEDDIIKREKYITDLQEVEEEIRNLSHELSDDSLNSDIGYVSLIEDMLDKQSQISKFSYNFISDEDIVWEEVDGNLKMNLYRIIQEAIQNINKYAKANNVKVEFELNNTLLTLSISDNGIGFDTASKSKGIGIRNMRSRVEKIKGNIEINSTKGKGSDIIINIPL